MAPRAFVAGLAHETNVFAPLPTGTGAFGGRFVLDGQGRSGAPPFPEALLDAGRSLASRDEIRLHEGPTAGAYPGGLVARSAYQGLRDAILAELEAAAPIDIVALHLHGAMIADGYDDCEGDLLARVRAVAGGSALIGAMIDPHAHLSARMVEESDLIVAYKEYPHTDFRERAQEVWSILLDAFHGRCSPVPALWDTNGIGIFHSSDRAVRALIDAMHAMERQPGVLSASLIHGFPWGDTADLGTRALVYSDADAALAGRLAADLAARARTLVGTGVPQTVPLDRAIALVKASEAKAPIVLADAPDNPGGGAAGDSTFVLRAMLSAGMADVAIGPLWDPGAVDVAFNAGPGACLPMRVGGKSGPLSGDPVDVDAEVIAVDPDAFQTFAGARFALGRTASLRIGGLWLVLSSARDQARGPELFSRLGIEPARQRALVVKSSQHFRAAFAAIASSILILDVPGALQLDFARYAYERVRRPRVPLDPAALPPTPVRLRRRQPRCCAA